MKIILFGKNGQVGRELYRALQPLGSVYALDRHTNNQCLCGDISDFNTIEYILDKIKPNVVVNAAAYTAVDQAENDLINCNLINHLAVKNLAKQCKKIDALLIHYSTDYVFSGEGNVPWLETDLVNPQNYYGETKAAGELALQQSFVDYINLRTSWVYAAHGKNFVNTMLKLAVHEENLTLINDQVGSPTGAALIANTTAHILHYYLMQSSYQQKKLLGHYHLAASGETTWYDYGQYIINIAKAKGWPVKVKYIISISTVNYSSSTKRPLNSRLSTMKLSNTFSINLPDWRIGVEQVIEQLSCNQSSAFYIKK